jgi:NAD(P)H-hydrate epimerase
MTVRLADGDLLASALGSAEGKAAAVLGPGFGLSPERRALANALALALPIPTVIDADALSALGSDFPSLQRARAARVLTPHPGEAARLLERPTSVVQADRYAAASELAARSGHVVVLKGARTIVAAPDGRMRICAAGTAALGSAGTGDVLSGAIAALIGREAPFSAAWAAVELHAVAGELAAESDRGLLASEVAAALPRALTHLRRGGAR